MIVKSKNGELVCNVMPCLAEVFINKNRILELVSKFVVFLN